MHDINKDTAYALIAHYIELSTEKDPEDASEEAAEKLIAHYIELSTIFNRMKLPRKY